MNVLRYIMREQELNFFKLNIVTIVSKGQNKAVTHTLNCESVKVEPDESRLID